MSLSLRATCPLASADLSAAQLWQAGARQSHLIILSPLAGESQSEGGSIVIWILTFELAQALPLDLSFGF